MQQEENKHTENKQVLMRFFDVEKLSEEDLPELSSLIAKYPYCQPLYLLAAKSAQKTPSYQEYLEKAAAIVPSRAVLYDIIHHPEKFTAKSEKELITEELSGIIKEIDVQQTVEDIVEENVSDNIPVSETENVSLVSESPEDAVYEEIAPLEVPGIMLEEPQFYHPEIENIVEPEEDVVLTEQKLPSEIIENLSVDKQESVIEDEVIEEIQPALVIHKEEEQKQEKDEVLEQPSEPAIVPEAPYIETLGDSEYIHSLAATENPVSTEEKQTTVESTSEVLLTVKSADVFRYHEERLPYTFLWWLNKTRKQYENTRPYATFRLDTSKVIKKQEDEIINHQIAENIFHLTSADELAKAENVSNTVSFDLTKKEHQIIERFIKEEPQITPPQANKIDTENKAKKSSEDHNELVSETLAKVYVEQMLYHKALDIYRKLSLKYPEKNAYFASQIRYLELKVN